MIAAGGSLNLRQRWQQVTCCLWMLLIGSVPAASAADDLIERFAAPETVWSSAISPDGKRVALGCIRHEARAVCVYELDQPGKAPLVISVPAPQQLDEFAWFDSDRLLLWQSRYVYVEWNKYWASAGELVVNDLRTKEARVLGISDVLALPAQGQLIGSYGDGVVRVDLATGESKPVRAPAMTTDVWFDASGDAALSLRTDRKRSKFFAVRGIDGKPVQLDIGIPPKQWYVLGPFVGGMSEGGGKVSMFGYFEGDALRYQEFDTRTGKRLPQDPKLPAGDLYPWQKSFSDEIVGVSYTTDVPRQFFFEPALETIRLSAAKALSGQTIEVLSWTDDRSAATLMASPPGGSATHYLFDRKQGSLSPLGAARPQLEGLPAATTTSLEYAARDGLKVDAMLTLPAGKRAADGPFPLLVMPRQGPLGRDELRFNWQAEYFAQRGYAVLRPNFRGSSGHGKAFIERGFGEFGGAMIDDMIDGVRLLVSSGLVDRSRICATGVAYGGYASLMMGLREPGLVRCVVAINPITDPIAMIGETLKGSRRFQPPNRLQYWEAFLGDRYVDKATAAAISPARSAQYIRVPVLLLQETQGTFAPASQARYLQEQMELYGRTVELREYEATDPQFLKGTTRRLLLTETDAFLTKQLGTNALQSSAAK